MRFAAILTIAITHASIAWGQGSSQTGDTVAIGRIILLDPGISLGGPRLLIPPSLLEGSEFLLLPFFSSRDYSGAPQFFAGWQDQKLDLMAPLRLQMAREEKLKTLNAVLGTVQLGGVMYLAYKHVKKYGFLK